MGSCAVSVSIMKIGNVRAIQYSLLFKTWQALAGLITIPILVRFLAPETQGFYYTFASLIALQSFFELGLSIVISVYASHEWHRLAESEQGTIQGDADSLSRLVSLGRFVFKYFGLMASAFLLIAGLSGYFLLSNGTSGVVWLTPWILHVVFSAGSLWVGPFLSLLEGCNQVARVAQFRLAQSILSNFTLWILAGAGFKLWSVAVASGFSLCLLLAYLLIKKRNFFRCFMEKPKGAILSWRTDMLPMQWRLAVQALFGYLSFPLYTILAYQYFGAIEAGRVGMTLQIVAGVQSFSLVFIIARAPEFALMVASGREESLFASWRKASVLGLGIMTFAYASLILALKIAEQFEVPQISRVLPMGSSVLLAIGAVLAGVIQCAAVFLRAHKRELLTHVGVISGLLYGLLAWVLCAQFGSSGLSASYLLVTGLATLPMTLLVFNKNHPHFRWCST